MAENEHKVKVGFEVDSSKVERKLKQIKTKAQKVGGGTSASGRAPRKKTAKATQKEFTRQRRLLRIEKERAKAAESISRAHARSSRAIANATRTLEKQSATVRKLEQQLAKLQRNQKKAAGGGRGGRGGAAAPGGRGGGGGGRLGGLLGGLGRGLLGGAAMVGGSVLGLMTSQISEAFSVREQYGKAYSGLTGLGASKAQIDRAGKRGVGLGFGPVETVTQAKQVARETGQVGAVTTAQQLSRTAGMDVGEAGGLMGIMTRQGRGFGGKAGREGKQDLVKTLAHGFESGLDRARMPEFMKSVGTLVQRQGAVMAGDVSASNIAGILQKMGASGQSGLQGARGANVLGKIDQAIKSGGGSEAGNALIMRAFGFGKPGSDTSYYEAYQRKEQGVLGEGGAKNLKALFSQTEGEYGSKEGQMLALSNMTGLTTHQLEAMKEVVDSNMSQDEKMKELNEQLKDARPLEEQSLDQLKELGDTVTHQAELQERMLNWGEELREPIVKMQKAVNMLVDQLMPAAISTLEFIAGLMESMAMTFSPQAVTEMSIERSKQQTKMLSSKYEHGDISRKDYKKGLKKIERDLHRKKNELGDQGLFEALVEGLDFITGGGMEGSLTQERMDAYHKVRNAIGDVGSKQGAIKIQEIRERRAKEANKTPEQREIDAALQYSFADSVSNVMEASNRSAKAAEDSANTTKQLSEEVRNSGSVQHARPTPSTANPTKGARGGIAQ